MAEEKGRPLAAESRGAEVTRRHAAAEGSLCVADEYGLCRECGVGMETCYYCGHVGYHSAECSRDAGTSIDLAKAATLSLRELREHLLAIAANVGVWDAASRRAVLREASERLYWQMLDVHRLAGGSRCNYSPSGVCSECGDVAREGRS